MRIYLAAPFFNPNQLALVSDLEDAIESHRALSCFSPRREGIISGSTREERSKMAPQIFASNCREIDASDLVFAVIDGRDAGVTWEIGYAHGRARPIVSFTNENFGLNVMIQECVTCHVRGLNQARDFFSSLTTSSQELSQFLRGAREKFRHSEPAAT